VSSFADPAMVERKWDGDGVPLEMSNCAGIGSAEDKTARFESAKMEPAWQDINREPGLLIWRIEDFKVVPWPKKEYGNFYSGDSYIILETVKGEGEVLLHHIFFWLGEKTSTDEMGTAAYKTVELDEFFHGEPTQSREVQGYESRQFRRLFPRVKYLQGGVDSGFHHVGGVGYQAKLLRVRREGKDETTTREVPLSREQLNQGDVFILDAGAKLYVWEGDQCSSFEKYEANVVAEGIEAKRDGHAEATHNIDDKFWELLGGEGPIKGADAALDRIPTHVFGEGILYRLSNTTGDLQLEEVARGDLKKDMLKTEDVFMVDTGIEIYLWVGKGADKNESGNALRTSMKFLRLNDRPLHTPIHMYKEGTEPANLHWRKIFSN